MFSGLFQSYRNYRQKVILARNIKLYTFIGTAVVTKQEIPAHALIYLTICAIILPPNSGLKLICFVTNKRKNLFGSGQTTRDTVLTSGFCHQGRQSSLSRPSPQAFRFGIFDLFGMAE